MIRENRILWKRTQMIGHRDTLGLFRDSLDVGVEMKRGKTIAKLEYFSEIGFCVEKWKRCGVKWDRVKSRWVVESNQSYDCKPPLW